MSKLKDTLVDIGASGFRSGYAPVASGTVGTLVAVPIVILLKLNVSFLTYFIVTLLLTVASFYVASQAEKLYGESDSSKVVIDEIVGFMITCLLINEMRWDIVLVAFIIFRLFDIFKIWPANIFDNRKGGFAVVMDDVVAGVYAMVLVKLYTTFLLPVAMIYFKVSEA